MVKRFSKEIFNCNSTKLPANLIGVAVQVVSTDIPHAGIFIRHNGESKLFHYTGTEILLEDINNGENYFLKQIYFIEPFLTSSFLLHCQTVKKEAKPQYGHFVVGGFYDEDGHYIDDSGKGEYMTCVGFCLNFIK